MADEAEKIGSMEFMSPINKENSFTQWNVCKNTKSTMDLYFNKDNTGFIEWDIPEIEETYEIGLTFEIDRNGKRTVTDYDGVFCLPDQAMDLLEKHGVDCTEMRRTLSDD